jgi:hypothetical protein
MLLLNTLTISSYQAEQLTVTWEFKDTLESLTDYEIDIYRSENPGTEDLDGYDLVASGISAATFSYDDTSVAGLYDPLRTWYYKIGINNTVTDKQTVQPEIPAYRKGVVTDKIALSIIRRKRLSLDKKTGRDFYILKRRTFGTHCPDCWDETTSRVTVGDCSTCYDTGWVGGYFESIYTKGMITVSPDANQLTMFGEWVPKDIIFYTLNFPPLRAKDIIVDDENQRWVVKQVVPTKKNGFLIEQSVQCSLIAFDDIVYTVDNEIGAKTTMPAVLITDSNKASYAHLATKTYVDEQLVGGGPLKYRRFAGSDGTTVTRGSQFSFSDVLSSAQAILADGSVQVIVNGVMYLSNTVQTSIAALSDFYISGQDVIVQKTAYGGTINIEDADDIGIYYQINN